MYTCSKVLKKITQRSDGRGVQVMKGTYELI